MMMKKAVVSQKSDRCATPASQLQIEQDRIDISEFLTTEVNSS